MARGQVCNTGGIDGVEEAPPASKGQGGREERVQQGVHVSSGFQRREGALDVVVQMPQGQNGLAGPRLKLPQCQKGMLEQRVGVPAGRANRGRGQGGLTKVGQCPELPRDVSRGTDEIAYEFGIIGHAMVYQGRAVQATFPEGG